MAAGSWDKTIRVWDAETLECLKVLEGHGEAVLALAVGDTFLVSGSYDTTVRFWDLATLRCIRSCRLYLLLISAVHCSDLPHCLLGGFTSILSFSFIPDCEANGLLPMSIVVSIVRSLKPSCVYRILMTAG